MCIFLLVTLCVSLRLPFSHLGWTQAGQLGITGWWTECTGTEIASDPHTDALSLWISMEDKYPLADELAVKTCLFTNIVFLSSYSSLVPPLLTCQQSCFPSLSS